MPAVDWIKKRLTWRTLQTVEPLDGDWLDNASWGQRIAMPPGLAGLGANGQVVPVGRLDRSPGPPRPYTVRLYRTGGVATAAAAAGAYPILRARVTIGVGGQNSTMWCDWAHGTQFSVVASSIVVDAVQEGVMGVAATQPIVLAVAFGQGPCARGDAIYTFMPAPPAVPGATLVCALQNVPQYATHVEVTASNGGNPNRDPLNQLRQGSANTAIDLVVTGFNDPELRTYPGVRLHPEANFISVRSLLGAVPWTFANVVFHLLPF